MFDRRVATLAIFQLNEVDRQELVQNELRDSCRERRNRSR
jgi:hypothetical protein